MSGGSLFHLSVEGELELKELNCVEVRRWHASFGAHTDGSSISECICVMLCSQLDAG
jgi:hypothetical protein